MTGITSECFKCYMSMVLNIVDLAAIYYTFNELINDLNTLMNQAWLSLIMTIWMMSGECSLFPIKISSKNSYTLCYL